MQIAAGEFKAKCLQLMDRVHQTHERVVITKRGKPVAQLLQLAEDKPRPVIGRLRGTVTRCTDVF